MALRRLLSFVGLIVAENRRIYHVMHNKKEKYLEWIFGITDKIPVMPAQAALKTIKKD